MLDALTGFFNAIGSLPAMALPAGAQYWLTQFGVTALLGGISTGVASALTIRVVMFFASPLLMLLKVGL